MLHCCAKNKLTRGCVGWKYYISYCVFLLFEVIFVWFLFPETSNRSLEELAFRTFDASPSVVIGR